MGFARASFTDVTTTNHYLPPDDPADPVAAALDHLTLAPVGGSMAYRVVLRGIAAILDVEGALTGLTWPDARKAVECIAYCCCFEEVAGRALRTCAGAVLADEKRWRDPRGVARALAVSATIGDTL